MPDDVAAAAGGASLTTTATVDAPILLPRGHVLILGAGLAGLRTAAELRERGFTGHLTVAGAEPLAPYDRPPLSKHLFDRPGPSYLSADGLGDLDSLADEVLLGYRATALRPGEAMAEVELTGPSGTRILRADVVVLALGAHAINPWPETALTLHSAEDAARLREGLGDGGRLVVVGAGWIGAEVAGQAASRGCEVTVLEAGPAPLARQLGAPVGQRTVPWYAGAGVDLRLATAVREVNAPGGSRPRVKQGSGSRRILTDAGSFDADVVLAAMGVRPATEWLEDVLPLTHRALPVDAVGRITGGPASVRAVGDCVVTSTPEFGAIPGGHWDQALTQPAGLAAGLLGQDVSAVAAPYVFSTQFGHELAMVGQPGPAARLLERGWTEGSDTGAGWTALYVDGPAEAPRLLAGFTAGRPRDVGALRRLLAGGARPVLDPELAADPQVPLKKAISAPR